MIRDCSLIILVTFLPIFSHSQTCIIAKKTKKAIYVGADSRSLNIIDHANNIKDSIPFICCKILNVGKYYFATSGEFADLSTNVAVSACSKGKTFWEVLNLYKEEMSNKEQLQLQYHNKLNSRFLDQYEHRDTFYLTNFLLFGVENDSLNLYEAHFYLTKATGGFYFSYGHGILYHNNAISLGQHEEIDPILNEKSTWGKGAVNAIRFLIRQEILAHPNEVAEPIDIIKITRRKVKWFGKKTECDNVNFQTKSYMSPLQ